MAGVPHLIGNFDDTQPPQSFLLDEDLQPSGINNIRLLYHLWYWQNCSVMWCDSLLTCLEFVYCELSRDFLDLKNAFPRADAVTLSPSGGGGPWAALFSWLPMEEFDDCDDEVVGGDWWGDAGGAGYPVNPMTLGSTELQIDKTMKAYVSHTNLYLQGHFAF